MLFFYLIRQQHIIVPVANIKIYVSPLLEYWNVVKKNGIYLGNLILFALKS